MSPPFVTTETAVAYRVPRTGRRFFTQDAAYRAAAKAKIKEHCECEDGDPGNGYIGYTCELHVDMGRYQEIVRRLAFKYRKADALEPTHHHRQERT